jgi:hypothetical protein
MHTARANQIDNEQLDEISIFETNQFPLFERYFSSLTSEVCAGPNPRFNCHGMTFASRRTGIFESEALEQILSEDGYEEIQRDNVRPGDVIVYYASDGDFEHSGLVVESPKEETLNIPRVRSKWAKYKELIHMGNRCPYSFANVKYFRVVR